MLTFNTDDPAEQRRRLTQAIDKAPDHLRGLFRMVRDAGLGFLVVPQGKEPFRVPVDRPCVVMVGDDLHCALGPGGFHKRSLRLAVERAALVSIVASGPIRAAYDVPAGCALAASALRCASHTMIIETRPDRELEWTAYVRRHAPDAQLILAVTTDGAGPA